MWFSSCDYQHFLLPKLEVLIWSWLHIYHSINRTCDGDTSRSFYDVVGHQSPEPLLVKFSNENLPTESQTVSPMYSFQLSVHLCRAVSSYHPCSMCVAWLCHSVPLLCSLISSLHMLGPQAALCSYLKALSSFSRPIWSPVSPLSLVVLQLGTMPTPPLVGTQCLAVHLPVS
jgi:hypothetical protein